MNIEDVYRTVHVDLNQDAGIKILPDIFHKDGTLNEDALRERSRRMARWATHHRKVDDVWFAKLRADIEEESNCNMWGALVAPSIALVVVVIAMIADAFNR